MKTLVWILLGTIAGLLMARPSTQPRVGTKTGGNQ